MIMDLLKWPILIFPYALTCSNLLGWLLACLLLPLLQEEEEGEDPLRVEGGGIESLKANERGRREGQRECG